MKNFKKQLKRETLLYFRQPRFIINSVLFFIMMSVFFPLTLSPDSQLLALIAPGIIWIGLLLSTLLSLEQLFQQDFDVGVLEQWAISAPSLALCVFAKLLLHWILLLIPILLFCPILALLFQFSTHELLYLMITLILGSPALVALGALASSFGLSLDQRGTLMALILFTLALPIIIFGASTFEAIRSNLHLGPYFAILSALSILAFAFLPFIIAAIIRIKLAE